jgi:hypothetical protein
MTRAQLEHLIRAAGEIAQDNEIVIIGSQAVLAQFPQAPAELLVSEEADLYPKNFPEKAIDVDGAIGERSLFHETHAIYAHGVAEETATLPDGWKNRLVPIRNENTRGVTGGAWKFTTWRSASWWPAARRISTSCADSYGIG